MGFDCWQKNYVKINRAPSNVVVVVGFGCCWCQTETKKREHEEKEKEKQSNTHAIHTTNKPTLLVPCVCLCVIHIFDFNSPRLLLFTLVIPCITVYPNLLRFFHSFQLPFPPKQQNFLLPLQNFLCFFPTSDTTCDFLPPIKLNKIQFYCSIVILIN